MKKKRMFLTLAFMAAVVFSLSLFIYNSHNNEIKAYEHLKEMDAGDGDSYKRPACESTSGTRGCGDRQTSSCSFGKKVNC